VNPPESQPPYGLVLSAGLLTPQTLASVVGGISDLEIPNWIRRRIEQRANRGGHSACDPSRLEACATAINRSDKKAALDQLSEATAKLKRLAAGLIQRFT